MIQAKIIADSIAPSGGRLTTLEIVFPRYILAELNTHRLFSKNSASSRAIPFDKMVKEVEKNPFIPYAWQKDHKGMQGTEYFTSEDGDNIHKFTEAWIVARNSAIAIAQGLTNCKVTKQLANRLLEPFMYHKVLISATEWENFFNLRCPSYEIGINTFKSRKEAIKNNVDRNDFTLLDWLNCNTGKADIHMMFLAEAIYDAIQESTPKKLEAEDWHIPYGDNIDPEKIKELFAKTAGSGYDPNNPTPDAYYYDALDALYCKISIARCARLSYQTLGDNPEINYEKDLKLYDELSKSGHWSPFEHVAKVMTKAEYEIFVKGKQSHSAGATWAGLDIQGWCRNFKGFIQYRELLD